MRGVASRVVASLAVLLLSLQSLPPTWGLLPPLSLALVAGLSPRLGVAALYLLAAYTTSTAGGLSTMRGILLIPLAALSLRIWPQTILWLLALNFVSAPLLNCILLAILVTSLQFAAPDASSLLMVLYAVEVNLKLTEKAPPSALVGAGFVFARGLPQSASGRPGDVWLWAESNLLGTPRFLALVAVYAASGALVSKLGSSKLRLVAPLPSSALISLTYCLVVIESGYAPSALALVLPVTTVLVQLAALTRGVGLRRRLMPEPPLLLSHLRPAWTRLIDLLRRGERVILVLGSRGCGKTLLIAEACAALGLEITRGKPRRGRVVHIEEGPDLLQHVESALKEGARSVVIEASKSPPLPQGLIRNAVYVPSPDRGARFHVLTYLIGRRVRLSTIQVLAKATEGCSLRALIALSSRVEYWLERGVEEEEVVRRVLKEVDTLNPLEEVHLRSTVLGRVPERSSTLSSQTLSDFNSN